MDGNPPKAAWSEGSEGMEGREGIDGKVVMFGGAAGAIFMLTLDICNVLPLAAFMEFMLLFVCT